MRVLLLGDGIAKTTGFAQILNHIAAALVARGDEVAQVASLDTAPDCDSRYYHERGVTPYFPTDGTGFAVLPAALRRFAPERIVLNMDPGTARTWLLHLRALAPDVPTLLYTVIEGAPIHPQFIEAAQAATRTLFATRWASEQVEDASGRWFDWVWHGVDPDIWHPLPPDERARVRDAPGWEGHFVVAYVARNVGRKAHDRLLAALRLVLDAGSDTLVYLHCAPFDDFRLQGWDLDLVAASYGVSQAVEFPSTGTATAGEPGIPLARKLACADLYVHPAQVEGFGLPILEAMAAGVPLVTVNDAGNMQEVAGDASAVVLDPVLRPTWFTGARLSEVAPEQIAEAILWAQANPDALADARARGLERSRLFRWEHMTDRLLAALDAIGEPAAQLVEAGD